MMCLPHAEDRLPDRPMLTCHLCVEDEDHDLCCFVPMTPTEAGLR